MRLGTCVALELLVGASLLAGLSVSVSWGVSEARDHWQGEARAAQVSQTRAAPPRVAAAMVPRPEPAPEPVAPAIKAVTGPSPELAPRQLEGDQAPAAAEAPAAGDPAAVEPEPAEAEIEIEPVERPEPVKVAAAEPRPRRGYYGDFHGTRDELLLGPLRDAPVKLVKFNRGGSSISLRIDFQNGAQAAFKPEQTAPQTVPRKEIAAYRIDRLLGLSAVPPAVGRKFVASELLAALAPQSEVFLPRLKEEMRIKNDEIAGELSWWIPVIKKASIDGYEIDSTDGIVTWKRYLTIGKDIPPEYALLLQQISSMVLFDFLTNNPDRWSGANARVSEDGRTLYFMDNTMSFLLDPDGHRKTRIYLKRSQKFSRSLVAAMRALTREQLDSVLARDTEPFGFLLTKQEIEMMMKRRDYALAYVDELIAEHGEDAVLVFP